MENQNYKKGNSRVLAGLFLLGIGTILFIRQFGFPMPYWLFQWPVILIVVGLFIGFRHNFRGPVWLILIIIGTVSLGDIVVPEYSLSKYSFPFIVIAVGLVMILRPRRQRNFYNNDSSVIPQNKWDQQTYPKTPDPEASKEKYNSNEDYIDSVAIFGSVRKVVVSKDFKGGDMVALFGGSEIDLSQADFNGRIILDVTQIFGGTKLFLPSNWDVRSEMVAFFGGIEDKRHISPATNNPEKMLILKGTSIFGGIEIRNY